MEKKREMNYGSGARVHNVGSKADRDRAVVLHSYLAMCKEFRVPRRMRLTPREIASMTNTQLYQASKDLYNNVDIKKAQCLAVKLGVAKPQRIENRLPMPKWLRQLVSRMLAPQRAKKLLESVPKLEPALKPPSRSDLVLVKPEVVNG